MTAEPEFVGDDVEDSGVSCASIVHVGGVFKTVTDVVALSARATLFEWGSSTTRPKKSTNTPRSVVKIVAFPVIVLLSYDMGLLMR